MAKSILAELEKEMKARNIKIPALSVKLGIPKDRIYKWYQEGTQPKQQDSVKIWNWINGENEELISFISESQSKHGTGNLASLIKIIERQQLLLEKQQETIHFLTTGRDQGNGGNSFSKKASG